MKAFDPLLMSPVKSTSISVDEGGGDGLKKDFQARRQLRHELCLCHSEGELSRKKYLSAFEQDMVVGASHTSEFHAPQFPIKNGLTPKGHPANLTTVGSIGVNMAKGLNIRNV